MNKYSEISHKQVTSTRVRIVFSAIFLLAIFAGLIVWPSAPGWFGKFKIHLGLDLQGGTHLVYQADVSALEGLEKRDGVEALRDVIERRVNAFGVGEPLVQTAKSGEEYRVIVELPGIKNIEEAKQKIKDAPLLEFKEEGPVDPQVAQMFDQLNEQSKEKAKKILDEAKGGADFDKYCYTLLKIHISNAINCHF